MGKHVQNELPNIAFKNKDQGCMWGILQKLDYSPWHNVKKRLPYKKHTGAKHAVGVGDPKKDIDISNPVEVQECIHAEVDKSRTEEQMMKSSQTTKSFGKALIKALIAKDMSKRKGQLPQTTCSQMQRTESIRCPGSEDQVPLADEILKDKSPSSTTNVMLLSYPEESIPSNQNCEASSSSGALNSLEHGKINDDGENLVNYQTFLEVPPPKEFMDALRIINMNREFFLKILQDPESPWAYHFHHQQPGTSNPGLSKSGSFHVSRASSSVRDFGPFELKYNQKEITSHAKSEGKLEVGSQTHNLSEFESTEHVSEQSGIADASLGLIHQVKRQSESHVAIRRFKDLKKKLKHAIRQSKKEHHRITMDAIFHTVPHGFKFSKDAKKPISDQWKEPATNRNSENHPGTSGGQGDSTPALRKQISFQNNSLERYAQLFESSFKKEAKCQTSERLKLRTEDVGLPSGSVPKSLRRILSLPASKSYFALQTEDLFDNYLPEIQVNTVKDSSERMQSNYDEQEPPELPLGSEDHVQSDAVGQTQKHLVEACEARSVKQDQERPELVTDSEVSGMGVTDSDSGELNTQDTAFNQGQGTWPPENSSARRSESSSISNLNLNVQDDLKFQDIADPGKLSILEEMPVNTVKDSSERIKSNYDDQKSLELPLGSEDDVQFDAIGQSKKHLVEACEAYQERPELVTDNEVSRMGWTDSDSGELATQDTTFKQGQGTWIPGNSNANLSESGSISTLDSTVLHNLKFQDIAHPGKLPILEDSEVGSRLPLSEGSDCAFDQQHESSMDSPFVVESSFDVEELGVRKPSDSDPLLVELGIKNKAEFNYVRDVLELSGFSRNEVLETWHSLNPSVFEAVEGCFPLEPECSGNEENANHNHLLLFDLINEVLMDIYESSLTYCPLQLSSLSHIRPLPVGYHVLEAVWADISWYLSWEPYTNQVLDHVVSRDLSKGDMWMNLQFEAENVGLELEDWIFDDLLDELCI